jgi:spermidine/putrescine-binding protein
MPKTKTAKRRCIMKNAILGIIAITLIVTAVVGFNLAGKAMRDSAIDGCYQTGRITITNADGNNAEVPDNYWFDQCMEKKGYDIRASEESDNE